MTAARVAFEIRRGVQVWFGLVAFDFVCHSGPLLLLHSILIISLHSLRPRSRYTIFLWFVVAVPVTLHASATFCLPLPSCFVAEQATMLGCRPSQSIGRLFP